MLNLKVLSAASLTLLATSPAAASGRGVGVDLTKTTIEKNFDVDVQKTSIDKDIQVVKNDVDKKEISSSFNKDVDIDKSRKLALESDYRLTAIDASKRVISKSVFASPVAKGTLAATVTQNSVHASGSSALGQTTNQSSSATVSNNALSGLKGVTAMNVNGGPNALQQANVSISVVATTAY